jgi:hypothetical protein
MTTVYVVWSGYENVDGIFSSKEKAEEYVRRMVATGHYRKGTCAILSEVVDELHESQVPRKES